MTGLSDPVAHLPAKAHPPRAHILDVAVAVSPENSPSGYEQREKTCKNCGAVRVTILPAGTRAWRRGADSPQITTDLPPPCDSEGAWPR